MATCETVRIKRDNSDGHGDYTIVDKRHYDAETMDLWDEEAHIKKHTTKKAAKKKAAKKAK